MSSKRTAEELGGSRQFKQTKLSFGAKVVGMNAPPRNERGSCGDTARQDDIESSDSQLRGPQPSSSILLPEPTPTPPPLPNEALPEKKTVTTDLTCVTEKTGDLFGAPPNSLLIHACNCAGHWGAGIAAAFRKRYPQAHKVHVAFCKSRTPEQLIGTAQLLQPSEKAGASQHYIGCLFTSRRCGKAKDNPSLILRATAPAMEDLLRQIKKLMDDGKVVSEIRMCKINSGLFAVPWERTKEVIEGIEVEDGANIAAWDREE